MFTGLVETVGKVNYVESDKDIWLIDIVAPKIAASLKYGDSVSVSGVCLTVVFCDNSHFHAQMMEETKLRTKLGALKSGELVNLERAMRADGRFDGHIVSGHIDGLATVDTIDETAKTRKIFFTAPTDILLGIVAKGSVTIDGVSLTVIDANEKYFSVGLIPATLAETSLYTLKTGDVVNIETDILGKYVAKYIETHFVTKTHEKETLTWEKLAENGWL